jgi:hypothetical protein
LLAEVSVVVGTPGSVYSDAVFADRITTSTSPFTVLVLDRAEELTEPDFVQFAKLATRWVLVGDAPPAHTTEEPKTHLNGSQARQTAGHNSGHGRNGRQLELPFAVRLVRHLDRETWGYEGERLVCRLAFPAAAERRTMTREPLLDRPEIELRFVSDDAGQPALAEVAFPVGTAAAAAKAFLFHQLGEVLLRPCGAMRWQHTPTTLTACWPAAEHGSTPTSNTTEGTWLDLEAGVREKVIGAGIAAFTAAVSFDLETGWDPEKAEAWLAEHMPQPCASRFAAIPASAPSARR